MNHINLKNSYIMKFLTINFFATVLILASCKKNPPTNPVSSNCLLQSYVTSDNSISNKINYDANNQVISVESVGSNYTSIVPIKDARNRIYKIDYYNGTTLTTETIYQFDASNRITLISYYQQGTLIGYASWTYSSGSRPTEQKLYNISNGNTTLTETDDYTYDSRGNLLTDGNETYTYDDKPNAIQALSFFPVALAGNANNITSDITKDNSGDITASEISTYTYDSNGNVIQRKEIDNIGVSTIYNYSFLCH